MQALRLLLFLSLSLYSKLVFVCFHMLRCSLAADVFTPTLLGKAIAASGLKPEEALGMEADLDRARVSLCTKGDVHPAYLVTPVYEELHMRTEHWQK